MRAIIVSIVVIMAIFMQLLHTISAKTFENSLAPLLQRKPVDSIGNKQEDKFQVFKQKVQSSLQRNLFGKKNQEITQLVAQSPTLSSTTSKRSSTISSTMKSKLFSLLKGGGKVSKKKLLILMSDTGGGHRASAQALDQAIQEQFPHKIDVEIMDIWTDHAAWPYNRFVPVYRFLAKYPILWRGFYAYGTFPLTRKFTEIMSNHACYQNFKNAIEKSDPDFVVSVHPLCQLMPITILQTMNKRRLLSGKYPIPFVTVVTDLGSAHDTWFDARADAIYIPSEAVKQSAMIRNHIPEEKMILKGLPIRPAFWKPLPQSKAEIRAKLGLPKYGKTVLLMGGGDGVGGLVSIAQQVYTALGQSNNNHHNNSPSSANTISNNNQLSSVIRASNNKKNSNNNNNNNNNNNRHQTQMIVICGHNKQATQTLQATLKPSNNNDNNDNNDNDNNNQVFIKGFVNNIDQYMAASDCLVTKAGPGTIAESMIRGLPMVLSSYLPGQVSL
jgi:1,2-diacylglycerol 3-beta-galactosyltransferase